MNRAQIRTGICALGLAAGLLSGCATGKAPGSSTYQYDQTLNQTQLSLLPSGTMRFPGEWARTAYHESSGQHFFRNKFGTTIGLARNLQETYPFYYQNQGDFEFTRAFFSWEAAFVVKAGLEPRVIKEVPDQNYLIWQVKGPAADKYFLYGAKGGYAYNLMATSTSLSAEEQIKLLELVFQTN